MIINQDFECATLQIEEKIEEESIIFNHEKRKVN